MSRVPPQHGPRGPHDSRLVAVTMLIALSIPAWPQDGVQFRGYRQRWSQGYEQDLDMKAMHTGIDHGRR